MIEKATKTLLLSCCPKLKSASSTLLEKASFSLNKELSTTNENVFTDFFHYFFFIWSFTVKTEVNTHLQKKIPTKTYPNVEAISIFSIANHFLVVFSFFTAIFACIFTVSFGNFSISTPFLNISNLTKKFHCLFSISEIPSVSFRLQGAIPKSAPIWVKLGQDFEWPYIQLCAKKQGQQIDGQIKDSKASKTTAKSILYRIFLMHRHCKNDFCYENVKHVLIFNKKALLLQAVQFLVVQNNRNTSGFKTKITKLEKRKASFELQVQPNCVLTALL